MNIQKFTQKSMEAIQDCEKLAYEYGNQEIEQEHLLVALLRQPDGLILKLIEKMEIQKEHFINNAEQHLAKRVKVSGGQVYIGQNLNKVLISAEDEAKQMGDEYVSTEHLLLGAVENAGYSLRKIFTSNGIDEKNINKAIKEIRGSSKIVDQNPEEKNTAADGYAV